MSEVGSGLQRVWEPLKLGPYTLKHRIVMTPHGVGWGQPGGCTIAWDSFVQCAANDVIKIKSVSEWIRHFREANYSQVVVQRIRDLV